MKIFGENKSEQINYLNEERQKLWDRVTKLEGTIEVLRQEIEHKASDSEKEAKEHSRKAAEFRNKIEGRLNEATAYLTQFENELSSVREVKDEINNHSITVNEQRLAIDDSKSRIDDIEIDYQKRIDNVNAQIGKIDEVVAKYPNMDETILEIDNLIETIEENEKKSGVTLTAINSRKKEIDNVYREIFGYTEKDIEKNEDVFISGLKEELENSYDKLTEQFEGATENVNQLNTGYEKKYNEFEAKDTLNYESINNEIRQLLPNALTAGLSSAFSKKKEEEEHAAGNLQKRFSQGIYFMIAVSLVPLIISIIFLWQSLPLTEVINRLPRLVLAIIPMYIPVLWFTISASKKLNLSKRLIEEYAHKEVLSKTYEGLATQISSIKNSDQSEELKYRLLASFLQVSSENPGKLISNYEASDHPVMDALEQSYKFQIALDKLEGIPGLGKVAAIFEKKSKRKLEEKAVKVDQFFAEKEELQEEEQDANENKS